MQERAASHLDGSVAVRRVNPRLGSDLLGRGSDSGRQGRVSGSPLGDGTPRARGPQVSPYHLLKELGEGKMGASDNRRKCNGWCRGALYRNPAGRSAALGLSGSELVR
jgi:hypothetical protein